MRFHISMRTFLAVCVSLVIGSISAGGEGGESLAEAIVRLTKARTGLCLHLGCGDGALTADLARTGQFVVHGVSPDAGQVRRARNRLQSLKIQGVATVDCTSLNGLPYADGIANLVVVDDLPRVLDAGCSLSEILRVLAPLGKAWVGTHTGANNPMSVGELRRILKAGGIETANTVVAAGVWAKFAKPRPNQMDEWTHARHGPDRNPVADDALVQPPNSLRWIYGPRWRGVNGTQLSANGRNIYADGTVRDAFNGLRICDLRSPGKYKYVTPLLAIGHRIYIAAPRASPYLQAADASTGKIVFTYERIRIPRGLAFVGGDLVFVGSDGTGCVDAETGEVRWMNADLKVGDPPAHGASVLVVAGQRVFIQTAPSRRSADTARLVCLDRETGRVLWQLNKEAFEGLLCLCARETVICCDSYRTYPKRIYAYSAVDGRALWQSPPMNEGKSVGVYAIDGLIWCQHNRQTTGYDAATGKIKRRFETAPGTFKCAKPAATTRYMPGGRLAFLDLRDGEIDLCNIDRNGCGSDPGLLFCNGLTYSFPKQCSCFSMLRGYAAFTVEEPLRDAKSVPDRSGRRVVGPAFKLVRPDPGVRKESTGWPTFRHDGRRSAHTSEIVRVPKRKLWESTPEEQGIPAWLHADWRNHPSVDGPVSSVVAGSGMLCVALPHSNRVAALDPRTGRIRWTFTAGARVLSPPTIDNGLCYFGAQDGWAYCLNLDDGQLVWKFRGAPTDRRILAHGQLESLWPISGGVLVEDGRAYFTAGRLSDLVGGLVAFAVDARTGELIWEQAPPTGYEYTTDNRIAPAYRNDVPVRAGDLIQLGHPRWIVAASTGEFARNAAPVRHRLVKPQPVPILGSTRDGLWDLSRSKRQGPIDMGHGYLAQEFGDVWAQQLVIRDDRIFGFQLPTIRTNYYGNKQSQTRNTLRLVAWDRSSSKIVWDKPLPTGTEIVAMISAGDTIFATGSERHDDGSALKGVLWAFSSVDGSRIAAFDLAGIPSGEGLVASYGRLYVTMQDGRLICLEADER